MPNWILFHQMDFIHVQHFVRVCVCVFEFVLVAHMKINTCECKRYCEFVPCSMHLGLNLISSVIYLLIDANLHTHTHNAQATHYWRHVILLLPCMTKETTSTIKANRAISLKNACIAQSLRQLNVHIVLCMFFCIA